MKQFFTLLVFILVFSNGVAGQTQKTLVKTMALTPTTASLELNLPAVVEVREWNEPTLRFVTTVDANVGPNVLKALTTAGRYGYEMTTELTTGVTVINMPKKDKVIVIGGQPLDDSLHILIYIPKDLDYELIGDHIAPLIQ